MRLTLGLFIFLWFYISYSQELDSDTLQMDNYQIIDFQKELKKFKDSVFDNNYEIILPEKYSKLDDKLIINNTNNLNKLYKLSEISIDKKKNIVSKLTTNGSISRGVTIGNNQNSVLNSELDLQITGKLSEKVKIKASIQDSNIPLQNDGYSQQIDEFDQIFIEITSDEWEIRGGDTNINQSESFFGNFDKKIQGLAINYKLKNSVSIEAAGAIVKGKYKNTQIFTENGNQGPYKLIGENGELYVLVVSGSESVFVNGQKIERGIDKDYIINYNSGEIIFNTTFPIMADMRVQIEYQVSEKNYNSFVGYTKLEFGKNRFKHKISFYNENDIKDQPLLQNISNNQIEILSNAGDDSELMTSPTGNVTVYNENRILYRKEIINNNEIFVFSNNPEDELFEVNFTNVGQNQGDYILKTTNTIENIYEYIPPLNGEKQGNYQPTIKLIAPEKLQLLTYNSSYQPNNRSIINIELAASEKDKNLFSKIDDADNKGFASRLNYKYENQINNSTLFTKIDLNYIEKKFQPIERIYNTEFNRDWDFNKNLLNNKNQFFSNTIFRLDNKKIGSLEYVFENLNFENNYKGLRNSLNINSNLSQNIKFNSNTSIMKSDQKTYSSEFLVSKNKIISNGKIGWAEANYNFEKKQSSGIQDLLRPDFGQKLFGFKKGFGDTEKSYVEIGYTKKINDSIVNGELNKVNSYDSYFINSQIINEKKTKLNIYINQNKLYSNQDNSKEDFLNTKLVYYQRLFKNIIDSNLYFGTSSGSLPKQDYTFVEVEPGLGNYKWIDINGNGIQELEEFEVAVFDDEAIYVRVLLPNQIFIKTYQNNLNYSMKMNFLNWKNSSKNIRRLMSRISNQFQYSIEKKTNLDVNPKIELNPFTIDENSLLAYNYSLKNIFYLNKAKEKFSFMFTYAENKSKNDYSFGSTKISNQLRKLNFLHKLNNLFLYEFVADEQKTSNWSENFSDKNYMLNEYNINPKLTYLSADNNRINFTYNLSDIRNLIGSRESLKQQNFGISFFLNNKEKRSLITEFNYFKNKFSGNTNSIISYVMMNGLQKGENYTWSLRLQRKISKLLDINFVYLGRKSENSRSIHNGSIQLKAIF